MLWGQTGRLRGFKGGSYSGPDELPWTETRVSPGLSQLVVYPTAEKLAHLGLRGLSGFFYAHQGRRDDTHSAPPEEPNEMALSDVFDDHDYRRQDLGTPRSPDSEPRAYLPESPDGGASTSPDASDAENVAPSTRPVHSPPDSSRGFWRFVPAFTHAGEWPGRPPDAAPSAGPLNRTNDASLAAALAPAPTTPPGPADAALVREGHLSGPARAFGFDHHPSAVLLQRSAEIPFHADVPHPGHAACDAIELSRRARTAGEFFEAHPGPHLLAYQALPSELRVRRCQLRDFPHGLGPL